MPKKWIASAIKHPGSFTGYCKGKGMKSIQKCARETAGSKGATTHRKRQANLARTLKKVAGK